MLELTKAYDFCSIYIHLIRTEKKTNYCFALSLSLRENEVAGINLNRRKTVEFRFVCGCATTINGITFATQTVNCKQSSAADSLHICFVSDSSEVYLFKEIHSV